MFLPLVKAQAQTVLLQESFETDGESSRYTSNSFYTAASDFWERTQNSNVTSRNHITNAPTAIDGTFYWAGEDTDQASGGEGIMTFNAVNVTGYSLDLDILMAFGRPNDGRLEPSDYAIFEYNMDGGGWTIFGAMYGDNDLPATNQGNLREDADLNGTHNHPSGQVVNSTAFQNFNFSIPATGTSCQIRLRVIMNTGTEELMLDNIRLNGTVAVSAPTSATVAASAFLEGAYNGTNLNTAINGSLPAQQPYNGTNSHSEATNVTSMPANAVDWVLVELREAGSAAAALNSTRVGSAAGLLMNNGSIKATDGTSDLTVSLSGNTGSDFFIVIYHRNHLPIMSASAISESSGTYSIDFTGSSANTYQTTTALSSLSGGKFGMPAGDLDQDGDIDATDLITWRTNNGISFSYDSNGAADFNLDGVINAVDRNDFHQKNTGKTRQVPSS
ncbi:MAG: hypothetical protein HEP71_16835 [Roseivirga sp.]|nr:hypothetical protein [Roseivirga sp.]